jgi:hypothetical protein
MSDAYENVMGGKLKLKGTGIKKKKRTRESTEEASSSVDASSSSAVPPPPEQKLHTATERRRLEKQQQRTFERIEKGEYQSHKERVRALNRAALLWRDAPAVCGVGWWSWCGVMLCSWARRGHMCMGVIASGCVEKAGE